MQDNTTSKHLFQVQGENQRIRLRQGVENLSICCVESSHWLFLLSLLLSEDPVSAEVGKMVKEGQAWPISPGLGVFHRYNLHRRAEGHAGCRRVRKAQGSVGLTRPLLSALSCSAHTGPSALSHFCSPQVVSSAPFLVSGSFLMSSHLLCLNPVWAKKGKRERERVVSLVSVGFGSS